MRTKDQKNYTMSKSSAASSIAAVCVMIGAACLLESCSTRTVAQQTPSVPIVGVNRVTRQELSRNLRLAAEFRPYQEVDIDAKVAGYVKSIYVDIGSHVRAGELLAVLEIPELQDQVNQAEGTVRQSEQEIQHAQFELKQAEAAHQAAHLQYTRLAQVSKSQPNLIAQQEIDDSLSKDQESEARVEAAKAALAAAKEQYGVAKANEDRVQAMYSYARITAPFSGVITKRYADTGAMLQAGTASHTQAMPLVSLSQIDLLRLTIPVPESVVPQVQVGMAAQVEVPSLNKTYQGKVVRFADQVDFSTRTMQTEIDVPNPKSELVPGMYAYATLTLERKNNVLTVPVQALDRQGDRVTVLRVDKQGKIERIPVQLGLETPDRVEIASGLNADDAVVVTARSQLREGELVQTKQVDLTAPQGEN